MDFIWDVSWDVSKTLVKEKKLHQNPWSRWSRNGLCKARTSATEFTEPPIPGTSEIRTLWDGWSYSYTWNHIRLYIYMIIWVSLPMQQLSISFNIFLSHFSSLRHRHHFGGKLWKLWKLGIDGIDGINFGGAPPWRQRILSSITAPTGRNSKASECGEKIPDPKNGPNHGEGMWRTPSKNKTWRETNPELIWTIQKMDIFDDVRWC